MTTTAPDQIFGYDVLDSTGNTLGSVDNVWIDDATNELEFIGVKTGWLMGKTHVLPTADARIADGSVSVPYSEDQVKNAPSFGGDSELSPQNEQEIYSYFNIDRSTAPSPTGLPAGDNTMRSYESTGSYDTGTSGTTELTDQDSIDVPVSEEELQVGKRQVEAGRVRLRKVVHTEHKEVPVELKREEIQVERVPASDATNVPDSAFQEGEIEVPLSQEQAVVGKEARVTGQVHVEKNVDTETQTVGGDIRREEVDVEGPGT